MEKIKVQDVVFVQSVDVVSPPPPDLTSKFKTLQEWLINMVETEKPGKLIIAYQFGLFESEDEYVIFLIGSKQYNKDQGGVTSINFEPSNMYYPLPESEYKNLTREQAWARIIVQFRNFKKTDKFKNSFFAKAKVITTDLNGEIWSR